MIINGKDTVISNNNRNTAPAPPAGKSLILGIETSCDETAAAVVEDGGKIRSNLISSQIAIHARFGGVVPEIASREHLKIINHLIDAALEEAGVTFKETDALAVSYGPGLVGALLIGVSTAKTLAYVLNKPLIAVNHLQGHLYANYLYGEDEKPPQIEYPVLGLIVSGGHTALVWMPEPHRFEILGQTRDDAAGEAFDKIARALKLGYPGGPVIDRLAKEGNPGAVALPRAYLKEDGRFDFSFSGLKSAVLNYLHKKERDGIKANAADVAASFQAAVIEVLTFKTMAAVAEKKPRSLFLSGGVAANSALRISIKAALKESAPDVIFHCPPSALCTDNAAMIAAAAHHRFLNGEEAPLDLNAASNLNFK